MHDVFSDIKSLFKVDNLSIDNYAFKLHYKITTVLLVAASLLLTQRQYFGDPIDCIVHDGDEEVIDTYCWIHSTYTYIGTVGTVGKDIAHPGVHPGYTSSSDQKHEARHHKYYQWVTLFVFLQAILCYMPRYLWKVGEGGITKMLVKDLDTPIVDEEAKTERKELLVQYFSLNFNKHNFYAIKYFLCEFLNFINIIGQIYFTDRFLGYEFTTYGTEVLSFSQMELGSRRDPMDKIFPKVAKCDYHMFGPSGTQKKHDALCVLPINVLSEKIFIFIWFWYILVAVLTGISLVYRIATIAIPPFRKLLLRYHSTLAPASIVDGIANKCQIGDWFLLSQLAKNMDPVIYKEFIQELSDDMKEGKDLTMIQ